MPGTGNGKKIGKKVNKRKHFGTNVLWPIYMEIWYSDYIIIKDHVRLSLLVNRYFWQQNVPYR